MPCPEPDPTPASPSPCRERAGLASRGGGRRPSYGNSDAAAAFSAIRFSTLQKKVEKFPSAWQRLLSRTPGLSSASPDAVPRLDNPLHKTRSFAGHILRHFRGSSSECVCAYYVYVHIYVCTRVCVCVIFPGLQVAACVFKLYLLFKELAHWNVFKKEDRGRSLRINN